MKKRIAFISEHASPLSASEGGRHVYVSELPKSLSSSGYEIDIYTRWDDAKMPEVMYLQPGIRVIHIKAGPFKSYEKEDLLSFMHEFREGMLSFIRTRKLVYGLIHANYWMSGLVASQLKEILGVPFVITFHELGHIKQSFQGMNERSQAERIWIEEDIIKKADQIIALCPQDKEDLLKYYNAPSFKITVIPCGFNPEEFYPVNKIMARQILNISPDDKVLLQLGRLHPRKGIDTIIKAMAHFKEAGVAFKLLIVGGKAAKADEVNPDIERLRQIAVNNGVEDMLSFEGRKSRDLLKYYYSAADVFVTTPWYEPFGITPLEAMACGTPVIASSVGGLKHSISDGETGLLLQNCTPDLLAEKIEELIFNKNKLSEMSRKAIVAMNAQFKWSQVAVLIENLYDRVLLSSRQTLFSASPERGKVQAA